MENRETSRKPQLSLTQISTYLLQKYGISPTHIQPLDGYDDLNFHIKVDSEGVNSQIGIPWEHGFVLKIVNSEESTNIEFICAEHELLLHLNERGWKVPVPVRNLDGQTYSKEIIDESPGNIMHLFLYQPGTLLKDVQPSPEIFENVGEVVGELTRTIKDFRHAGLENKNSKWSLESALVIRNYIFVVKEENKSNIIRKVLDDFENDVLQGKTYLEKGTIHGDVNENNLLVRDGKVCALIDFGDSHHSFIIFELAIAICYMLLYSNQLDCPKYILRGYRKFRELSENEKRLLKTCICTRICQSLVLGLHTYFQDETNTYVLQSQKNGWSILMELFQWSEHHLRSEWGL